MKLLTLTLLAALLCGCREEKPSYSEKLEQAENDLARAYFRIGVSSAHNVILEHYIATRGSIGTLTSEELLSKSIEKSGDKLLIQPK